MKRAALGVLVVLFALQARTQSINTFAGGGTLDGQRLSDLVATGSGGVAFDSAGNLIAVFRDSGQILRVDSATGLVTTLAGNGSSGLTGDGGLAINASLRHPADIVLDAADNIYVADTENDRVRRIDAKSGIITTVAGGGTPATGSGDNGPATGALLGRPWGLAISRGGLLITETSYNTNRVRRVDLATGVITTIAGPADGSLGDLAGDNGPATGAKFNGPFSIAADASGNLFIADRDNKRIRRVDTGGTITTYAGGGTDGNFADGIPATSADLGANIAVALDRSGNVLIGSIEGGVRRIDKATGTITTLFRPSLVFAIVVDSAGRIVATSGYGDVLRYTPGAQSPETLTGKGVYVGDGLPATAAILHSPKGLALDRGGNLYIVDQDASIIRRVSAADGTISTVAGQVNNVYAPPEQEGTPAKQAAIGYPSDVAFDSAGNLYIADVLNERVWRVDGSGNISTFAGGGSPADHIGDNGAANLASLVPYGIAFDKNDNLYIADTDSFATVPHARIRRVDASTKIITTVAGSATVGFAGDGDLATKAQLDSPADVVVDDNGVLFISDYNNGAIRRVGTDGIITTYAGRKGESDPLGDGGPAAGARISPGHMEINRATGELFVTDSGSHRIRKFDRSGTVSTVAGSGFFYLDGGFGGDNGRATDAKLSITYGISGVTVSPAGDVYLSDSENNRVRVVLACRTVAAPQLIAPAAGATQVSTAPRLTWTAASGAFRYDVQLDTVNPPAKTVAADIDEPSLILSNLQPSTQYFWRVTAKGDRFCPTVSTATSATSSFTTTGSCAAGAFDLTSPPDNATGIPANVLLTWQPSAGASSYDLYLGATNPPALLQSGITTTSAATLVAGSAYWFVVAHAACDATETATSAIRKFSTSVVADCIGSTTITPVSPPDDATGISKTTSLQWTATGDVDSFDVYFGTTNPPPLLQSGLPPLARSLSLPLLDGGVNYLWRVVANSHCLGTARSTPLQGFITLATCRPPGTPQILFAPANVTAGSTYAIVWSAAPGIGTDGGYLVERSTSPTFVTILDAQVASSTAASFSADTPGTIYHRVRAIAGCDPANPGPASDVKSVSIVSAPANVIFTVPPHALVTGLGERLEDHPGTFTLENIGSGAVQVIVGRQELGGSPPFFSIAEDAAFITLLPQTPRTFTIRYSGPPVNTAAAYQGVIFVAATGQGGLAVTPYAFVNLKVGGGTAATPQFLVDGSPSDYVAFDGFSGDDTARPPRQISIRNNGTTPMELAAEVAPEVWLVPESGWNATPLAPGATRTVNLFTQRSRAPNGSPLPRYTYFTVRTKDGASARLLVQDNDQIAVSSGRATSLDSTTRSFVVPEVTSRTISGGKRVVSRMRLTNVGGDAVQAEVIYTPRGADGFDASQVQRATVVLPANDVVTITDPIVQLFRLQPPASGAIEVRLPRERVGLVAVRSSIIPLGGTGAFETPVVTRGDGARAGSPHAIYLTSAAATTLTLAETSGNDGATVHVTSFDANGQVTASQNGIVLGRYGMTQVPTNGVRMEITVDSGGGSVVGLGTITTTGESGATIPSRPITEQLTNAAVAGRLQPQDATPVTVTTVVPVLHPSGTSTKLSVGLVGLPSALADFVMTYRNSAGGGAVTQKITLDPAAYRNYDDLLGQVFNLPGADGSVFIQTTPGAKVYAVIGSGPSNMPTPPPTSPVTLPTTLSEALTGFASSAQRVLSLDGLEQSTDPTRGDRWLLTLNEVAGLNGSVSVRMYEAGNRTSPIARRDFAIAPYQQLTLDSVFNALGLEAADRKKDRTNVQVVVIATSGKARVAATATAVARNGETRLLPLTPAVGSGAPNVTFVAPVIPQAPPPERRRRAGH